MLFINPGVKGKLVRVDTRELLYVESAQNYVFLHLQGQKIMTYLTLQELSQRLTGTFIRIHKSYIVNLDRIKSLEFAEISLDNGRRLPLGRHYRDAMHSRLASSIVQNKR